MVHRHLIDVHVLLTEGDRLLLTQRGGSDRFAGRWHLPSGKVDRDEPITVAAAREAFEEVGALIDPADLRVVHVVHVAGSGPEPRLGIFLHAAQWRNEPGNSEPEKCLAVQWFPVGDLDQVDIIEYPAEGIRAFLTGASVSFGESGWGSAHYRVPVVV
ncbi:MULTISPECIES: NUDIX domain-containing protein [unclassified Nocardia]|uniref:NUDIX domain-containing protein n=1 Tax=unclassified Nocardia TaxID=2637762 RepID=UPI001CE491BE|nr:MULTISPECIES: NUDIX domain-containing protein [unclassified Nocardia]